MVVTNYLRTEEYDVVIAGGGATACVIAGRLASADPSLSILLIEEGRDNYNDPSIRNPVVFLTHLAPGSRTAKFYKARRSEHTLNRDVVLPAGSVLGGGSSINFMLYTRAQGIDFDSWKTEGWYQDDMLPLFNKLEAYHPVGPNVDPSRHGHEGPIHITKGYRAKHSEDEWMKAVHYMGDDEITDMQDLKACNAWSRWARYVSPDGFRQDAAHCYVHPLVQSGSHPNFHILVETRVQKVIFDKNKRATGVEITPNPDFSINPSLGQTAEQPVGTVKAKKLVVVSCGALNSPIVLERSGIGGSGILNQLGIPVVSDLPGVGENLQDHHLLLYPYLTNLEPDQTIDGVLSGRVSYAEAIRDDNPQRRWNVGDISSKLRPRQEEVDAIGGSFKELHDKDYRDQVEKPLILCAVHNAFFGDHTAVPEGQYMTVATYSAYPYSRGFVHATGKGAGDPLDLETGFLSHEFDVTMLVWAYKKSREVMRRTSYYRGELAINHPVYPKGSGAALSAFNLEFNGQKRCDIKNMDYSEEDDAAIAKHIRQHVATTWHSLGTCAMRPREDSGVVDGRLNVHGVSGLKVADMSIPPENVGANTYNTALAIGEKAADIIIKELGLDKNDPGISLRQLRL